MAGSKTLVESAVAGYTAGTWSCVGTSGLLGPLATAGPDSFPTRRSSDLTITNDDQAASLTIVKRIVNDNGGTKVVGDFGVTTSAGALVFGARSEERRVGKEYRTTRATGLGAGSKTRVESAVAGYRAGPGSCVGTAGRGGRHTRALCVWSADGGSAEFTITNDDQAASLTIVKRIVNDNGGTKVVGDFGVTTSAGALVFGA